MSDAVGLGALTATHNQLDQQLRPIVPWRANAPIDWPGVHQTVAAPRHATPRHRCGGGRLDPSKRWAGRRRDWGVCWRGAGEVHVALREPLAHIPHQPRHFGRAAGAGHPDLKRIAYDTPISAVRSGALSRYGRKH
jgi:hypothetical protein